MALCIVLLAVIGSSDAREQGVAIGPAKPDEHGFLTHSVRSPYQSSTTEIKVLLPDRLDKNRRYRMVYVLPVEAGDGKQYGHGLLEIKKLALHQQGLIFVMPTFSALPWYADHPTDPLIRQEAYLLKVVLPYVEQTYPVRAEPQGRLLLGFSKSGYGAFSLLLRHPDIFGKAAAWDAPLNMDQPNRFGMAAIYGTPENFAKYRIPELLSQRAGDLRQAKRLALLGHASFTKHHQEIHDLLVRLKIPHEYRDDKKSTHHWNSGWIEEGIRFLAAE